MANRKRRSSQAQSIMEAVTAALILVPIALCLLDLIVIVLANQINDRAAKNTARAAANQAPPNALKAANNALKAFHTSELIGSISIKTFTPTKDDITVETEMDVHLPVPFPGYDHVVFTAKDVEPIMYVDTQ